MADIKVAITRVMKHVLKLPSSIIILKICNKPPQHASGFRSLMSNLWRKPVIKNVLRASLHPDYKPWLNSFPSADIESREVKYNVQCFGEIGCLVTSEEFYDPLLRPINLPPYSRDQFFDHYKPHTQEGHDGLSYATVTVTRIYILDALTDAPTIVDVAAVSMSGQWDMVQAFHSYGDINVITVDWSGGSLALYGQAVANTRVVGLEVAYLVNLLQSVYNVSLANVHIIGHSLGAHISGYAGERIPGLGRITGLDPAYLYFQNMDPVVRLDSSDANFVDVIHSDAVTILSSVLTIGYGMEQPVGHIDFYPNNGQNQPGCSVGAAQSCDHIRAPKLFTDSILSLCPYTAFQCDSFEKYEEGLCMNCGSNNTNCAPMGLHADKWQDKERENVKMFLSTREGPTYCSYHYRLDVSFSDPENKGDSLRGRLKISFISEDGTLKEFDLTANSPVDIKKGSSFSYVLTHPDDIMRSRQALISWKYEPPIFSTMSYCFPLFCSRDLKITALILTSYDSKAARLWDPVAWVGKIEEIVMCHMLGDKTISIPNGNTVAVTACPTHPSTYQIALPTTSQPSDSTSPFNHTTTSASNQTPITPSMPIPSPSITHMITSPITLPTPHTAIACTIQHPFIVSPYPTSSQLAIPPPTSTPNSPTQSISSTTTTTTSTTTITTATPTSTTEASSTFATHSQLAISPLFIIPNSPTKSSTTTTTGSTSSIPGTFLDRLKRNIHIH
ncbi:unnamed protein product, partial [Meganyctiphanes norvegica]